MHDMTPDELHDWLVENYACKSARLFCEGKSLSQAWNSCKDVDWLDWFFHRAYKTCALPSGATYRQTDETLHYIKSNWNYDGTPRGE